MARPVEGTILTVVREAAAAARARLQQEDSLAAVVAAAQDTARVHADAAQRAEAQTFVDLMIPVVKGWSTETGIQLTSMGVQIHGGMGFIEETGAAQHFRDSRIAAIYEGTTAIQANDLIGRKTARDSGAAAKAVLAQMRATAVELAKAGGDLAALQRQLSAGVDALEAAVDYVVANFGKDIRAVSVGSVPYLMLFGVVAGGWQMARAALVAKRNLAQSDADKAFYTTKVITARFYGDHVLTQAPGLADTVVNGAAAALDIDDSNF